MKRQPLRFRSKSLSLCDLRSEILYNSSKHKLGFWRVLVLHGPELKQWRSPELQDRKVWQLGSIILLQSSILPESAFFFFFTAPSRERLPIPRQKFRGFRLPFGTLNEYLQHVHVLTLYLILQLCVDGQKSKTRLSIVKLKFIDPLTPHIKIEILLSCSHTFTIAVGGEVLDDPILNSHDLSD